MKSFPNNIFFEHLEQQILTGETVKIAMKGHSMLPFLIEDRDKIFLKKEDYNKIKIGDVLLFKYNGNYILHRFIKEDSTQLIMRGDGNLKFVEPIKKEDIIAKLIKVEKQNGRIINCSDKSWIFFSSLWQILYPLRRILLAVIRRIIFFNKK